MKIKNPEHKSNVKFTELKTAIEAIEAIEFWFLLGFC